MALMGGGEVHAWKTFPGVTDLKSTSSPNATHVLKSPGTFPFEFREAVSKISVPPVLLGTLDSSTFSRKNFALGH
jgi:hypothetical protein